MDQQERLPLAEPDPAERVAAAAAAVDAAATADATADAPAPQAPPAAGPATASPASIPPRRDRPPRLAASTAAAISAAMAAALAACGGSGDGGGDEAPGPAPAPTPAPTAPPGPAPTLGPYQLDPAEMAAARFVQHAAVASTEADIAAVKVQGATAWLQAQMAMPVAETAWDWLVARGYGAIDESRYYDSGAYATSFVMGHQLVKQPDIVRKRVALALSEYFVVGVTVAGVAWTHLGLARYWDRLNAHAFGNFRALLEEVTLNPVMGAWLNTRGNAKEDPVSGRVPDENYAREVMQLFTIGLVQLNLDGTPVTDAAGRPLATYTQDEVSQLARAFTGYEFALDDGFFAAHDGGLRLHHGYLKRPMALDPSRHSTQAVRFLGTTIAAGTPGPEALRIALDTLFNHPNVGPFFARQMIQRLVTGHPSPAYVARVAARFNNNGAGVRGDLKAVWQAILLDEEATGSAGLASTTHGKLREPMVRAFQWGRTFAVESLAGSFKWSYNYDDPAFWYGQAPFWSPSVFNFFSPGYVPPGTAMAAAGATAPEFQIVNESTTSQWINAIELWVALGIYVVWPDRPGYPPVYEGPYPGDGFDIVAAYTSELALAHDPPALLTRLNLLLAAGQVSEATLRRIAAALEETPVTAASPAPEKRGRVVAAITMLMCCAEYLVQK